MNLDTVRERIKAMRERADERDHCSVCAEMAAEDLPACLDLLEKLLEYAVDTDVPECECTACKDIMTALARFAGKEGK